MSRLHLLLRPGAILERFSAANSGISERHCADSERATSASGSPPIRRPTLQFTLAMKRHEAVRPWWLLPPGHLHPIWWIAMSGALLWADYVMGSDTPFPVA